MLFNDNHIGQDAVFRYMMVSMEDLIDNNTVLFSV